MSAYVIDHGYTCHAVNIDGQVFHVYRGGRGVFDAPRVYSGGRACRPAESHRALMYVDRGWAS